MTPWMDNRYYARPPPGGTVERRGDALRTSQRRFAPNLWLQATLWINEANQEVELRLVIGQLEEFAKRVSQELQEPDWDTRREVVRALVKKVEIDEQEIRIVYRVSPSPFEGGPQQGSLQHCWGRDRPT